MKKILNKRMFSMAAIVLASLGASAQESKNHGIQLQYMDKSVKPSDDFFSFVNGTWVKNTEIPSDRTTWGSFNELVQNTDRDVLAILNKASKDKNLNPKSDQAKAVNLYKTILDTVSRNKQGIAPLKPYLAKINALKNIKDVQSLMVEMESVGGVGFFGVGVGSDEKDSNKNIVSVNPGALGLPDRDYYVSDDADSKEKREKYELHIARMMQYIGETPAEAKKNAAIILALETALAKPRLDRVEMRDSRNSYNPMTVAALQKLLPSINWEAYLKGVGLPKIQTINVTQPKYMEALEAIFKQNKLEDWKEYMKWTFLNQSAGLLTTEIETANWEFYSKTLYGSLKQRPRDEDALQTVNWIIGESLGQLYVAEKFPPEAKEKAEKMIKNVILAFENRINNLPWMTKATKANAVAKLHKIRVKIGYPDTWKDYSAVTVAGPETGGSYFQNMQNLSKWNYNKDIAKLNKPVDKDEWFMSPQTVNAYFNPAYNEIVFPAAILQPPFYDYKADEAVNYGGIGAVIGHEISHGFDDSGARYNADGNLADWWSESDLKQFTGMGGALADQYSALQPLPGTFVDGKFTLGENIGDLGGVNAAYDGLKLYLKQNGNPGLIDGYTPEQRFFISWATIWRTKMRDEAIKSLVKTDPHSPGMYRAYVPLQNMDSFYDAFGIKKGDGMFVEPDKRVKIW